MDKRDYCFTLNAKNNQTKASLNGDLEDLLSKIDGKYEYFIAGYELAPSTNRQHYQGFVQFRTPMKIDSYLKHLNRRIHWEVQKKQMATVEQAAEYAKKDGEFIEHGSLQPRVPKASLDDLCQAILEHKDPYDPKFLKLHILYGNRIDQVISKYTPDVRMTTKPHVTWLYGRTEAGKTSSVKQAEPSLYEWEWETGGFQNYDNEEAILIDDLREKDMKFTTLLRILDWNSTKVNRKNKNPIWLKAKRIYITAPKHPTMYYRANQEDITQLTRRIECIKEMN